MVDNISEKRHQTLVLYEQGEEISPQHGTNVRIEGFGESVSPEIMTAIVPRMSKSSYRPFFIMQATLTLSSLGSACLVTRDEVLVLGTHAAYTTSI